MNLLYAVTLGLLSAAALLTLVRLVRGPSALDRVMALDVIVTLVVAGTAVGMVLREDPTPVPALVVLTLLAFIGSVTAAHLVEKRQGMR
ncbi:monovalent cation/H+ antiporter complex subunit F [Streptomyces sp. NPDC006997]|uniref:monovalent cation/H+ antiporter complex subunit F n=1 Tax=Streptomyces sp. NPDC006997 TaxID=3155356 RepID=UPI0033E074E0